MCHYLYRRADVAADPAGAAISLVTTLGLERGEAMQWFRLR
jgi:hypothetical protein